MVNLYVEGLMKITKQLLMLLAIGAIMVATSGTPITIAVKDAARKSIIKEGK